MLPAIALRAIVILTRTETDMLLPVGQKLAEQIHNLLEQTVMILMLMQIQGKLFISLLTGEMGALIIIAIVVLISKVPHVYRPTTVTPKVLAHCVLVILIITYISIVSGIRAVAHLVNLVAKYHEHLLLV